MLVLVWADLGETARDLGRPMSAQIREYPELLRAPRFWGYSLCAALASGAYFAFLGGAPWVGEHVFGLTPAQLGLGLGAPALGYFFGNYLSARHSVALGVNRMVLTGCLLSALGIALQLLLFGVGLGSVGVFFGGIAVMAMGNGMTMPNTIAGTLSVRPALAGSAAGLGGALQIGGGAVLATLAGHLLVEGAGATTLLWLMLASATGSILSILYVILRTGQLDKTAGAAPRSRGR